MDMSGWRFGIGVTGGLLLGLLIVGFTASSYGLAGAFAPAVNQNVAYTQSSSTVVYTMSSTSASIPYTVSPSGSSNASLTSVSTSSTQSTQPPKNGTGSAPRAAVQVSPSRLESIAGQPLLLNGLVLLPVLVAIAVGALLYRASNARGTRKPAVG